MEEKSTIELSYLALGDSYTIGECVEESERWSVQLAHKLTALGKAVSLPKTIARTGWTTDELKTAIISENISQKFDLVFLLRESSSVLFSQEAYLVTKYIYHYKTFTLTSLKKTLLAGSCPCKANVPLDKCFSALSGNCATLSGSV